MSAAVAHATVIPSSEDHLISTQAVRSRLALGLVVGGLVLNLAWIGAIVWLPARALGWL